MVQPGQTAPSADWAGEHNALVFRAGPLLCALRLDEVIETMRPLANQPIAGTPAFVIGICIMRGIPTLVIDVARLLGDATAEVSRFISVRTERGPVAFATGAIEGVRTVSAQSTQYSPALLGDAAGRLIAAVGTIDAAPVLLLPTMRLVPDEVWATAAVAVPS
jgi:purine-binding chemotaxis protein CheW